MNLRNDLIKRIEDGFLNQNIILSLIKDGYKEEDIIKELEIEAPDSIEKEVITKEQFLEYSLSKLRTKIESNNKFYKDTNKHDIIRSRQHFQDNNVKLSNELYRVKNLIKGRLLEYELSIKELEKREPTKINSMAIANIGYEIANLL